MMMHYAPAVGKCLLHQSSGYARSMSTASDRLKEARERAGFENASAAAAAIGVPVATYVQHENGNRGFPAERAKRYAKFFRVAPEWLLYGTVGDANYQRLGPQVFVKGDVAAGIWKEAWEYEPDEWAAFTGRADVSAPLRSRFGLRVVGDSMNDLYPPGTIIECVEYDGSYPIPTGKRVVVQRVRSGTEIETTVKEYVRSEDGVEWLVPRSSNPAFQMPVRVDDPGSGIDQINIIAVVVASVRPE